MNYLFKLSVLNVTWHRINTSYVTPLIIPNIRNWAPSQWQSPPDSARGNLSTLVMLTSVKDMMDRHLGRLYHISISLYISYSVFRVWSKVIHPKNVLSILETHHLHWADKVSDIVACTLRKIPEINIYFNSECSSEFGMYFHTQKSKIDASHDTCN